MFLSSISLFLFLTHIIWKSKEPAVLKKGQGGEGTGIFSGSY